MVKSIEERVTEYRDRLVAEAAVPKAKPTPAERNRQIAERLAQTEIALGKADHRRIKLLLRAASLAADREDYGAVHGYAGEIAQLCRSRVLGIREAHPIMSSLPPTSEVRALVVEGRPPIREESG